MEEAEHKHSMEVSDMKMKYVPKVIYIFVYTLYL